MNSVMVVFYSAERELMLFPMQCDMAGNWSTGQMPAGGTVLDVLINGKSVGMDMLARVNRLPSTVSEERK